MAPGEPRPSPKPQPLGANIPMMLLITTSTCCLLFILWRRASALRKVVGYQLGTWTARGGGVRLEGEEDNLARLPDPDIEDGLQRDNRANDDQQAG